MFKNYLINRFKQFKRQSYINQDLSYKAQYAFIGAGNHSLNNLYPCILDLRIPLKYICTANIANAKKMALRFQGAFGTDNISDILNDPEVKGVFVSLPPLLHYQTLKKLFSASKHVFIEKPPCYSIDELKDLITLQQGNYCLPGLQKRFCTINRLLKKKITHTTSYHYRYLSGPYPEGNPVFDLFIHPVDNVIQLFGKAGIIHISKVKSKDELTVYLLLNHGEGATGFIELSTNYSWNDPVDQLEINNEDEILKARYPNHLSGIVRIKPIFGLPLEKVIKRPVVQKIYLNNNGFSPAIENNSLVVQGFYEEIRHFVHSIEKNEPDERGKLAGLQNVYEILEMINRS